MSDAISPASGKIEQNLERRNKLGWRGLPNVMRNGGRDRLRCQNRGRRVVARTTMRAVWRPLMLRRRPLLMAVTGMFDARRVLDRGRPRTIRDGANDATHLRIQQSNAEN